MSNATQRNFGAAQRERDRRVGLALDGSLPVGSLAVTGDPGWDAFFGSLHDKEEAARASGMNFRADLGGIGRWAEPSTSGMRVDPNAQNYVLGRLAEESGARRMALKQAADANVDSAIADMQGSYDRHVMDSVGQPAIEPTVINRTPGQNGNGDAYVVQRDPSAPPDERSDRARMVARLPGSLRPAVDAALSPLDRADRTQDLAEAAQEESVRAAKAREEIAAKQAGMRKPLTQTSESSLITKLAADWTKANANNQTLDRQFNIMKTGLDRYDKDPNGASQAVLITFQKMLDPESVVRESEYDRSAAGLSLKSRIQGYVERLASGGAGVPKADLEQMVKTAEEFKRNTQDAPERARSRLKATADRYELPHELVFGQEAGGAPKPEAAGSAAKSPTVKMRAPNGFEMDVPADQVQHYIGKGASRVVR